MINSKTIRVIGIQLLYAIYKQLEGTLNMYNDAREIYKRVDSDPTEFEDAYNYLRQNGYIIPFGAGYNCKLTYEGKTLIESRNDLSDVELIKDVLDYMDRDCHYHFNTILEYTGIEDELRIRHLLDTATELGVVKPTHPDNGRFTVMRTYKGTRITKEELSELMNPKKESDPAKMIDNSVHVYGNNYGNQSIHDHSIGNTITQSVTNDSGSKKSILEIGSWVVGIVAGLIAIYEFIIKPIGK